MKCVATWDTATGRRLPLTLQQAYVNDVVFSPDGKSIAIAYGVDGGPDSGAESGSVRLLNLNGGVDDPGRDRVFAVEGGEVVGVAFSHDGKSLAAAFSGGVAQWDVATGERLKGKALTVEQGGVVGVAFSHDDKTVAAAFDHGVAQWDAGTGERLEGKTLTVTQGGVVGVAFGNNGKTVAVAYRSGVALWDAATGQKLEGKTLTVTENEGQVLSMAYDPDGNTIAVGYNKDGGGGVKLLHLDKNADDPGEKEETFPMMGLDVESVAFSPDGSTIAAGFSDGSGDGGVLLFAWGAGGGDVDSGNRIARRIANRNFTLDEWRQYFPDEPYRRTFRDLPWPPSLPTETRGAGSGSTRSRRRRKSSGAEDQTGPTGCLPYRPLVDQVPSPHGVGVDPTVVS